MIQSVLDPAKLEIAREAARAFLNCKEENDERLTRYFDGSDKMEDVEAYYNTRAAYLKFARANNNYWGENDCQYDWMNVDMAYAILPEYWED